MKNKKIIYYWACDISNSSGEGILGNSFLNKLKTENRNVSFKNLNFRDNYQKVEKVNIKNNIFNSNFHKYVYPIIGLLKLWIVFFKGKKICYINYLPLWNFIIFLFLPPKTIIGPITGSIIKEGNFVKILNFFERISLFLIKYKYKKVYFSHNFYNLKYNLDKKKYVANFILNDFKFEKKNKQKKFNFVIYFRKDGKLKKEYIFEIIKELTSLNYKFAVIGDKIKIKGVKNFGFITRNRAIQIISKSEFAIANPENLYSYFVQDCLKFKIKVFYNIFFKKYNIFKNKQMIPIKYKLIEDLKIIKRAIRKI